MKFELNKNDNSKKLIIGISILFCAVILIIGVTTAYFTQSGIGETGNIVTSNINGTIGFTNNNDYMRYNLIPVKEGDVSLFATKNSVNASGEYTNEDICHYQDDMYACSLYEFTITNNADVTQDMKVTLNPDPNEFTNLHYLVYESKQLELNADSKVAKEATPIDKENASTMIESVTLTPEESKTYTVVFYIKAMGYDQTGEDADKNFGAIIRVDSITTGEFEIETAGTTCYDEPELITEGDYAGGYRLTKFNGLVDEEGNPKTVCGVSENNGFYSVTIPSEVGGVPITMLGNKLFNAVKMEVIEDEEGEQIPNFNFNNYSKINNIVISEGIKVIENGDAVFLAGTFSSVGTETFSFDSEPTYYDTVKVTLPSTLEVIGDCAFMIANVEEIKIPANVRMVGAGAFGMNMNLTNLEFVGANDGTSKLKTIGDSAFEGCNITTDSSNPLIIPYSVQTIENSAFSSNYKLTKLELAGSHTLVIDDPNDVNYNLLTIGDTAFYGDGLDYSGDEELILPARVSFIDEWAFRGNPDDPIHGSLKNIRYMGDFDLGNSSNWTFATVRDKDGNVMQS